MRRPSSLQLPVLSDASTSTPQPVIHGRARLGAQAVASRAGPLRALHRLRAAVGDVASDRRAGGVRDVASAAWPVVFSMLSFTAMGVVDTLFVAQLGRDPLAGAALGHLATMLTGALLLGGLRGVNIVVAQAVGAGELAMATRAGWAGAIVALVAGLGILALAPFASLVAALFGGNVAVQEHAATTFAIRAWGAPAWLMLTAIGQAMQGRGDTRTPMVANVGANLLNVALDALLVFGWQGVVIGGVTVGAVPAMGVAGAAWATSISLGLGGLGLLLEFWRRRGWARPGVAEFRALLVVGLPIGVRFLLDFGGWATLTALLARVGAAEVAATQVAIRVISVSFLPGFGISEAASMLVGQAVGAGDDERARRVFRSAAGLAVSIMAAFAVVFALWPVPILAAFAADDEVLAIGRNLLLWAAAFQVFDALCVVAMGALGGAGDTRFVMWAVIVGTWLVQVPLGWWLGVKLGYGAAGVWAAVAVECAVKAAIFGERWRRGGWRGRAVVQRAGEGAAQAPAHAA